MILAIFWKQQSIRSSDSEVNKNLVDQMQFAVERDKSCDTFNFVKVIYDF